MYITHACAPTEEVLPRLKNKNGENEYINFRGAEVKATSLRYAVWQKSAVCSHCGIKGDTIAAESCEKPNDAPLHFNLYATTDSGEQLMMHKWPKVKGGPKEVNNYVLLCDTCMAHFQRRGK